jgi:hypothetical protein
MTEVRMMRLKDEKPNGSFAYFWAFLEFTGGSGKPTLIINETQFKKRLGEAGFKLVKVDD